MWGGRAREDVAAAVTAAYRLAGGLSAELRLVRVSLDADRTMPRADRSAAERCLKRGGVVLDGVAEALSGAAAAADAADAAVAEASAATHDALVNGTFVTNNDKGRRSSSRGGGNNDGAAGGIEYLDGGRLAVVDVEVDASAATETTAANRKLAFTSLESSAAMAESWSVTSEECLLRHLNRLHAVSAVSNRRATYLHAKYAKELETQHELQTKRRRESVGRAADRLREVVNERRHRLGAMLAGARGDNLPADMQMQGLTAHNLVSLIDEVAGPSLYSHHHIHAPQLV